MPNLMEAWNRTTLPWWPNRVYHAVFFFIWLFMGTQAMNEFLALLSFVIASIHLIALSNTFRPRENT